MGVRPEGLSVFVVNYNNIHVVGPFADPKNPRRKTKVHATLDKKAGWIQIIKGRINTVPLPGSGPV